jgi:hypothetical protein
LLLILLLLLLLLYISWHEALLPSLPLPLPSLPLSSLLTFTLALLLLLLLLPPFRIPVEFRLLSQIVRYPTAALLFQLPTIFLEIHPLHHAPQHQILLIFFGGNIPTPRASTTIAFTAQHAPPARIKTQTIMIRTICHAVCKTSTPVEGV